MKTINYSITCALLSLSSLGFTAYANTTIPYSCSTIEQTYIDHGDKLAAEIKSEQFDPTLDSTIFFTGKICGETRDADKLERPSFKAPKTGDSRTISQHNQDVQYEWQQVFGENGWQMRHFNASVTPKKSG